MTDVERKIQSGAMVVDVRTTEEFNQGHYPGAVNIPVDQVCRRIREFGVKSSPIVLYCASGNRSAFAARQLKAEGFTDVVNGGGLYEMPGDWENADYVLSCPIERK